MAEEIRQRLRQLEKKESDHPGEATVARYEEIEKFVEYFLEQIDQEKNPQKKTLYQAFLIDAAEDVNALNSIKQNKTWIGIKDKFANNGLHWAAFLGPKGKYKGCPELADFLIKKSYCATSNKNVYGWEPLHLAAFFGQLPMMQYLHLQGATETSVKLAFSNDYKQVHDFTPLHLAIIKGHTAIVAHYFARYQNQHELIQLFTVPGFGNILHLAIWSHNATMLNYLLTHAQIVKHKALYNDFDHEKRTPLSLAAQLGDKHAIRLLCRNENVNLLQLNGEQQNALHLAVSGGHYRAVKALLLEANSLTQFNELTNQRDKHHFLPESLAQQKRDENKKLLDQLEADQYALPLQNTLLDVLGQYGRILNRLRQGFLMGAKKAFAEKSLAEKSYRNLVFQGGGPKGIAYIGALRVLEKKSLLTKIKRVGGTSAGAITALAVALGLKADDTLAILSEKPLLALLEEVNIGNSAQVMWEATRAAYKDNKSFWNYFHPLRELSKLQGLCAGNDFRGWINQIITNKLKQDEAMIIAKLREQRVAENDIPAQLMNLATHFTFGDLKQLITWGLPGYKHLYVVATRLSKQAITTMDSESDQWASVIIADAIRASMSIPGVFAPHALYCKHIGADGPKRALFTLETDTFVDGSLLKNYPVDLFDRLKYQQPFHPVGEPDFPIFNEETLGFSLYTPEPKKIIDLQITSQSASAKELAAAILGLYYNAEQTIANVNHKSQDMRTLYLNNENVSTLEFDIDPVKQKQLIEQAEKDTEQRLTRPASLILQTNNPIHYKEDSNRNDNNEETSSEKKSKYEPRELELASINENDKQFAIGKSDFETIIANGYRFIDKSLLIKDLIDDEDQVKLILRPRRFGKTLNMSMIKCFFDCTEQSKSKLFHNLKIWQAGEVYRQQQGQYPVISLTFKDIKKKSFALAYGQFQQLISDMYAKYYSQLIAKKILGEHEIVIVKRIIDKQANPIETAESLKKLTIYLHRCYGKPVVLLIDEYDTPIHFSYSHNYYSEMTDFIRDFLAPALKDNDAYVKQVILTGILRVAKDSIFTGLNNFRVHSVISHTYNAHFGFEEEEVAALIKELKTNKPEKLSSDIRQWYGGFRIGKHTLYNPWCISNFMKDNNSCSNESWLFKLHWLNTSENQIVTDLLNKADKVTQTAIKQLLENQTIIRHISEHTIMKDIAHDSNTLWSFLLLSGYLTTTDSMNLLQNAESQLEEQGYKLKVPNHEVHAFYDQLAKQWYNKETQILQVQELLSNYHKQPTATSALIIAKRLIELNAKEEASQFLVDLLSHADATIRQQARRDLIENDLFNHTTVIKTCQKLLADENNHPLIRIEVLEFVLIHQNKLLSEDDWQQLKIIFINLMNCLEPVLLEHLFKLLLQSPESFKQDIFNEIQTDYLNRILKENSELDIPGISHKIPLEKIYVALKMDGHEPYERESLARLQQQFFNSLDSAEFVSANLQQKLKKWWSETTDYPLDCFALTFELFQSALSDTFFTPDEQKELWDNYQAQQARFYQKMQAYTTKTTEENDNTDKTKTNNLTIAQIYNDHRHVIILGDPGSGKTTLLRWLTCKMAQAHLNNATRLTLKQSEVEPEQNSEENIALGDKLRSPILIKASQYLSYYKKIQAMERSIEGLVSSIFVSNEPKEQFFLKSVLARGKLLILIDGVDEIAERKAREALLHDVQTFLQNNQLKFGQSVDQGNRLMITSRIVGEYVARLDSALPRFTVMGMMPKAVEQFFQAWFLAAKETESNKPDISLRDFKQTLHAHPQLNELVRIPQLANLVATAYYEKRTLPESRAALYQEMVDSFFDSWGKRREEHAYTWLKNSNETLKNRSKVIILFGKIAYIMHQQASILNQIELEKFVQVEIKDAEEAQQFLHLMQEEIGLLTIVGQDEARNYQYGFLHRTIQEFFIAYELVREIRLYKKVSDQARILAEKLSNPLWREPLLLAVGIMAVQGYNALESILSHLLTKSMPTAFATVKVGFPKEEKQQLTLTDYLPLTAFFVADALKEISSNDKDLIANLLFPIVMQFLQAYDHTLIHSAGHQLHRQIELRLLILFRKEDYQFHVEEALYLCLNSQNNRLTSVTAEMIRRLYLFTPRLLGGLQQALPYDSERWQWSVQRALLTFLTLSQKLKPPINNKNEDERLFCEQLVKLDRSIDPEEQAHLQNEIKQQWVSKDHKRKKLQACVEKYWHYLRERQLLEAQNDYLTPSLHFKQHLVKNPSCQIYLSQHLVWLRIVLVLYGGYHRYEANESRQEYWEMSNYLGLNANQRETFIEYYGERWGEEDTAYKMAVYLDTDGAIHRQNWHLVSTFNLASLYRESPLTNRLLEWIGSNETNLAISLESLWHACLDGDDIETQVDCILAWLAVGICDTQYTYLLDHLKSHEALCSTLKQRLAQVAAGLSDSVSRSMPQLWQDYQSFKITLSPSHRSVLLQALLAIGMTCGAEPPLSKPKSEANTTLMEDEWAEVLAAMLTSAQENIKDAVHELVRDFETLEIEPTLLLRAFLNIGHSQQLCKPKPNFAWSWLTLPPENIDANDIPALLLNIIEAIPNNVAFLRDQLVEHLLPLIHHNLALRPEVAMVVIFSKSYLDSRAKTLQQLYPSLPKEDSSARLQALEQCIIKDCDGEPYYEARALSRLAVYVKDKVKAEELLNRAFTSSFSIIDALRREQALEQILRGRLMYCLPTDSILAEAYQVTKEINSPIDRARALGRLIFYIPTDDKSLGPLPNRAALLAEASAVVQKISQESVRANNWQRLAPLCLFYDETADKTVLDSFSDPLYRAVAGRQYGRVLMMLSVDRPQIHWAFLMLYGAIHDLRQQLGDLANEALVWRQCALAKEPISIMTETAELQRRAMNGELTLNSVAILACDNILQCAPGRLMDLLTEVLAMVDRPSQETLPLLYRWQCASISQPLQMYASLVLSEITYLNPMGVKGVIDSLQHSHEKLRYRAARVIHHSRIVPKIHRRTRLLSVIGWEVLEQLQAIAISNSTSRAVALQINWLTHDLIVDDVMAINLWVKALTQALHMQDANKIKLYSNLLNYMEVVTPLVWEALLVCLKDQVPALCRIVLLEAIGRVGYKGEVCEWQAFMEILPLIPREGLADRAYLVMDSTSFAAVLLETLKDSNTLIGIQTFLRSKINDCVINFAALLNKQENELYSQFMELIMTNFYVQHENDRTLMEYYKNIVFSLGLVEVCKEIKLFAILLEALLDMVTEISFSLKPYNGSNGSKVDLQLVYLIAPLLMGMVNHLSLAFAELTDPNSSYFSCEKLHRWKTMLLEMALTYPAYPVRGACLWLVSLWGELPDERLVNTLQAAMQDVSFVRYCATQATKYVFRVADVSYLNEKNVHSTRINAFIRQLGEKLVHDNVQVAYLAAKWLLSLVKQTDTQLNLQQSIVDSLVHALSDARSQRQVHLGSVAYPIPVMLKLADIIYEGLLRCFQRNYSRLKEQAFRELLKESRGLLEESLNDTNTRVSLQIHNASELHFHDLLTFFNEYEKLSTLDLLEALKNKELEPHQMFDLLLKKMDTINSVQEVETIFSILPVLEPELSHISIKKLIDLKKENIILTYLNNVINQECIPFTSNKELRSVIARTLYQKGESCLLLSELQTAITYYEAALVAMPDLLDVFHNLACCYALQGDAKAESAFRKGLVLKNPNIYCKFGQFLYQQGTGYWQEAIDVLKKALQISKQTSLSYGKRDLPILNDKRLEQEITQHGEIKVKTELFIYYLLVKIHYDLNQRDGVDHWLEAFTQAMASEFNEFAYRLLAYAYNYTGLNEGANHYRLKTNVIRQQLVLREIALLSREELLDRGLSSNENNFSDSFEQNVHEKCLEKEDIRVNINRLSPSSANNFLPQSKICIQRDSLYREAQINAWLKACNIVSDSLQLGAAIGQGDCFFDSVAQALNQLTGTEECSVKSLRLFCKDYAIEHGEAWVKQAINKDEGSNTAGYYEQYLVRVSFTAAELEKDELKLGPAVWGRPKIEGRMFCAQYGIQLHMIEIQEEEEIVEYLVDAKGEQEDINPKINYDDATLLHIVNYHNHYVPLLRAKNIIDDTKSLVYQTSENTSNLLNEKVSEIQEQPINQVVSKPLVPVPLIEKVIVASKWTKPPHFSPLASPTQLSNREKSKSNNRNNNNLSDDLDESTSKDFELD